jgi:N-acetylglucosamine-6-phosphate deacetylase
VNGFAGVDFQSPGLSPSGLRKAVDGLGASGVLRFFVALITDRIDSLCAKLRNIERIRAGDPAVEEAVCGYHIEGPWLSPEPGFCGAHDPSLMKLPVVRDFELLQEAAGGRIKLVTLAPELPGSAEMVCHMAKFGVHASLGHTNASDVQIGEAVAAGAVFCTHLGNGVPAQLHRHDNIVQRLLARDELTAFFIPDGIHLPPPALKNFFRAKPAGKALFTTDCMAAAGAPPGRYHLAHHVLEVGADRVVRAPGTSGFAGSSLTPSEVAGNACRWIGLGESEAHSLYSTAVAGFFGIGLPALVPEENRRG